MIDEVRPFEGSRELLAKLRRRGFTVVLASSGHPQHVDRSLDLLGGFSPEELREAGADLVFERLTKRGRRLLRCTAGGRRGVAPRWPEKPLPFGPGVARRGRDCRR